MLRLYWNFYLIATDSPLSLYKLVEVIVCSTNIVSDPMPLAKMVLPNAEWMDKSVPKER